jgi:hypothetical protein
MMSQVGPPQVREHHCVNPPPYSAIKTNNRHFLTQQSLIIAYIAKGQYIVQCSFIVRRCLLNYGKVVQYQTNDM